MSDYEKFMKEQSIEEFEIFDAMHRDCPNEFANIVKQPFLSTIIYLQVRIPHHRLDDEHQESSFNLFFVKYGEC